MARSKLVHLSDLKTGRKGQLRRRSVLWRGRRALFLAALLLLVAFGGTGYVVSKVEIPKAPPASQTSFICAADVTQGCNSSNALAKLHGEQDRVEVPLSQVPLDLQHAVLSIEDRDFFKHGGVDPVGIARAAWTDIRGGSQQGGSTITQQYVKNVFLTQERTLTRKLKEAVMSVKLEQKMTKRQILQAYLNTVYFGRGAYGVQAASRVYFGTDVSGVSVDQAAYLAGLIQGPETADFQGANLASAKRRRSLALHAMAQQRYLTPAQAALFNAVPFDDAHGYKPFNPSNQVNVLKGQFAASDYFVEYVRQWLVKRYGEATVYGGGLRVYTTLDLNQQQAAYSAVGDTLNQPGDPAGALVAVDGQGHITAMMGGRNFAQSQVNLAVGRSGGGSGRQPGSTFKPFALAEALHEGYSLESQFTAPDEIVFPKADNGQDWKVKGGCCGGKTSLLEATQDSINTVYAQLMLKLGATKVVEMANNLGITTRLQPNPSLVLGSGEVSVLDMASAFSTFADKGTHVEPLAVTRVETADGQLLESFAPQSRPVISEGESAKVSYALQQVVLNGTGKEANLGDRPAAGKTGTTDDNKDAWFVGYTPQLTASVWMGYPGFNGESVRPMEDVHGQTVAGGGFPAQIWSRFMRAAMEGQAVQDFPAPGDLSEGKEFNPDLVTPSTVIDVPTPTAPQYTSPQYTAPQTTAPQYTAPQTTAPQSTAPQSTAPQTTAPQTTTPQYTTPQYTAPATTAPVAPQAQAATPGSSP